MCVQGYTVKEAIMNVVEFQGSSFEVMHVVDPDVAVVFLRGAVQGCAQITDGKIVANLSADGSATISACAVAEVALLGRFGVA
jgi:hypothetical protein